MSNHLKSISIANFRAFRSLHIEKVADVNLIVGKNNVGKTCLLEALWLYASFGSPEVIRQILTARGEMVSNRVVIDGSKQVPLEAVRFLFHGRNELQHLIPQIIEINDMTIYIRYTRGGLPNAVWGQMSIHEYARKIVDADNGENLSGAPVLVVLKEDQARWIDKVMKEPVPSNAIVIPVQFIPGNGLDDEAVNTLWHDLYLTVLQDDVEAALRLMEPGIQNVGLINVPGTNKQVPQVRMKNLEERLLLSSLGDGMNRLFGLALALVNARDGFLLVDEIGNGIHYSVQPALWDFLFTVSRRLNVQVFATTHSWDVIEAFQQVAAAQKDSEGMLISLRSKQGQPGQAVGTLFNEDDLTYITQEQIEVR